MSDDPSLPFVRGTVGGIGALAAGYLVTYLWYAGRVRDSLFVRAVETAEGQDVTAQMVGWVFANAHFVTVATEGLLGLGAPRVNLVSSTDTFSPALYAVPVLALVLAGAGVARWVDADGYGETVVAGASVAFGYLPATGLGVVLSRVSFEGASLGPELFPALVVAGVAYPLSFGALGAVLWWRVREGD